MRKTCAIRSMTKQPIRVRKTILCRQRRDIFNSRVFIFALLLGGANPSTTGAAESPTAEIPKIVHSDAKQFTENGKTNACALLIMAYGINGEYISAVIKLQNQDGETELVYTVLSGYLNYANGRETYDYVEDAWLASGDISTRSDISAEGRGPSDSAYKAWYTASAYDLYSRIVHSPFELTLVTALHREPYTQTFDQPFDAYVSDAAHKCLKSFEPVAAE